jgi:MFS transporter, Spinster family, sphingosine-1-phosphate transporter
VAALAALVPAAEWVTLAGLIAPVRAELWLRDWSLGLLLAAPPAAALLGPSLLRRSGGRAARHLPLVGAALAVIATALAGASRGLWTLLVARAAAGLGGGLRDRGLAAPGPFVAAAAPLSVAVALALPAVAERWLGWRGALAVAAVPGLGALVILARRRGGAVPVTTTPPDPGLRARWRALDRPGRALFAGAALRAGALAALLAWIPAYLERSRGVPRPWAAVQAAVLLVMAALAGAAAARPLEAALARRFRAPARAAAAAAALAAAPTLLVAFLAWRSATHLAALVAGLAFALIAALADLPRDGAEADERETARLAWLLGALPAPALVGALSDRTSLGRAVLAVPLALLAAAAATAWGARTRAAEAARREPAARPVEPRQRGRSR